MASKTTPGLVLRHLRFNEGLSVEDLAKRVGVSRQSVYDMEKESYGRPRAQTAKAIADVFGVKPTDIWPVLPPESLQEAA